MDVLCHMLFMLRLCVSGGEPTRKMGSAGVHWGASRDLNGTTQQHTVTRSVPRNRHAQISERQDSQLNNIAISVSRYARCQPTNMTEKKDKDGDRDLPDTCRPQSGGGESAGNRQPAAWNGLAWPRTRSLRQSKTRGTRPTCRWRSEARRGALPTKEKCPCPMSWSTWMQPRRGTCT
jgi:hypothetical protein